MPVKRWMCFSPIKYIGIIVKALKKRDKERIATSEIPKILIQKLNSNSQSGGLSPLQSICTMSDGLCSDMNNVKLSSPPRSVLPKNQMRGMAAITSRIRHSIKVWRLFGVCKGFMAASFCFDFCYCFGNCRLHVDQPFTSVNEEVFGWFAAAFDGDGINKFGFLR